MKPRTLFCAVVLLGVSVGRLPGQQFAPPAAKPPDEATLKAIAARTEKLERAIAILRKQGVRDPVLADVEVCHRAAVMIVRHGEWFQPSYGDWTLAVLDRGLLRASQAAQGESPWLVTTGQEVVRGYRSRIDGSVQPYSVSYPADYGKEVRKRWRLDVVLHGRDAALTEVKFLYLHGQGKAPPKEQDFIRIDVYGRGNVAYRWAGETDVFEVVDNFIAVERLLGRERLLDPHRGVLRGFSMGGAGSWHIGLHHPDRWCLIGPGAGFTTTRGYIKGLPAQLPYYQEACLHIYDAVDYAENAFNVPVVAYSGSDDPQIAAARNIEERLKSTGISMTHLVAPGLGHSFPAEWQKKAEAEYSKHAGVGKGRQEYPPKIRFVTWTLRYPSCSWVEILGMEQHYRKTVVDAERTEKGFNVKTANVTGLRLGLPDLSQTPQELIIDGQQLTVPPHRNALNMVNVFLQRRDGRWQGVFPQKIFVEQLRQPRKIAGLQGPIDDAFMEPFLCVRGTGKPWHPAAQQYADKNLERFANEWNKFLRGDLPIKDDTDVTEDDISSRHLVLFGDPSSNSVIAQVIDGLPLQWTREKIVLDKAYSAADHLPVMIYPSPLNSSRYVVLNSGHTFHADDFRGTNALLYPRLGDWAVLKLAPTANNPLAVEISAAGLFSDRWQLQVR